MIAPGTMQRALEPPSDPAWVVDADGYMSFARPALKFTLCAQQRILGRQGTRAITYARLETGSVDCRMLFVEGTGRGHPAAQFARRVAQRARVGLQLIQLEIEDGEVEVTFEASFEGVNLAQGDNRGLATTAAISSGTRPTTCFDARGV